MVGDILREIKWKNPVRDKIPFDRTKVARISPRMSHIKFNVQ